VNVPLKVKDNAYRTMSFSPIKESDGKTFCFSIRKGPNVTQQLAVQLSEQDKLQSGNLTIGREPSNRDVIFQPIYAN